jgi:hypothetical protein
MKLIIGKQARPIPQYFAYLESLANGVEIEFDDQSDEILIDNIPSQVAWKNRTFPLTPWAKYVMLDEHDLDFDVRSEEEVQIYYGLVSMKLLNFDGYVRLSREWSTEFEMVVGAEGWNYINTMDSSEFIVRTSVEFIRKPDNTSICAMFLHVTSKSRKPPLKSFPKGCAPFFYPKYMKIGIYAVAFAFSRIADPYNCLLYLHPDDAEALNFSGVERGLVEVHCDTAKLDLEEKIEFNLSLD